MIKAKGTPLLSIDLGKAQEDFREAEKVAQRAAKALARAEDEADAAGKRLAAAREVLARGAKAVLG